MFASSAGGGGRTVAAGDDDSGGDGNLAGAVGAVREGEKWPAWVDDEAEAAGEAVLAGRARLERAESMWEERREEGCGGAVADEEEDDRCRERPGDCW